MQMTSQYPTCSVGLVLPLTNEGGWNMGIRATLYFIAMLYFFLGGSVVMDYVLASTSIITSNTKKIYLSKANPDISRQKIDSGFDVIEVRVWHDTIVNLSLMAFSTSAYEILLCTIEIIGANFDHGELGPGTIVGSAVFNTLVTTSVCIVSVPQNETRKIEKLQVYCVSMVFAIASYAWLVFILYYTTPKIVTLWESIITVLLFPIFIILVWLAHHNFLGYCATRISNLKHHKMERLRSVDEKTEIGRDYLKGEIDREKLAVLVHKLKRHSGLTDRDAATIAGFKLLHDQPHSALWYRLGAIRSLTAGYRYMAGLETHLQQTYKNICRDEGRQRDGASGFRLTQESAGETTLESYETVSSFRPSAGSSTITTVLHHPRLAIVEFHSAIVAVDRNVGSDEVTISRYGSMDVHAKVRLTSIDGTAKKNRDYMPIDQILIFEPGQNYKHVRVVLLNASGWEEDEEFFLRLSLIHNEHNNVELGRIYIMAVTLIDGKNQSIISFEHRGLVVKESAEMVVLMINRHDGAAGPVSIHWKTVDGTAASGRDFVGGSGELVFNSGEMSLNLEIPIINHMTDEKDMHFVVELFAPSGRARLGRINRCAVTIINDDDLQSFISAIASVTTTNMDAIRVTKSSWSQQMRDALLVDGGRVVQAKPIDYLAHFFSFLWKALFSVIPPPTLLGGWPCYLVSLIALGCMALLMGDSAKTFGCLIRMDTTITAISFVAIGASLPEVLCARRQTQMERTADVCMVGMAGRISANLMLGLGIPWLIAVIYHQVQGTSFIVHDNDVGRNVIIFIFFALVAQSVLIIRRVSPFCGKAEFGGPRSWRWMTSGIFILLWIGYLTFAHYLMHGHITPIE